MKKLVRGVLLSLAVITTVPTLALPPVCSVSYCQEDPDIVCSLLHKPQVMTCGEWCASGRAPGGC